MTARHPAPRTIAIVAYPGSQTAAALGLADMLRTADRLAAARRPRGPRLAVVELGPAPPGPSAPRNLAALVLPPSLQEGPPAHVEPRLRRWLVARHAEGTLLCSVCAGAFVLAETGLLDNRPATTHWILREPFEARFPRVQLDVDRLLVDDGDLLTAGGVMAWTDLALRLVARFLGPALMLETARLFLVDPGGREQRFYRSTAPALAHGDAAVLKVQRWLQAHPAESPGIPGLAARAGLGERTFQRRFLRATGVRPTEYIQRLRVARARTLLEAGDAAVDEVAWQVGYRDPGAFRRVFLRQLGLSPGEYRRRFGISALSSPPEGGARRRIRR